MSFNGPETLIPKELQSDTLTQHFVATMFHHESDITPYLTDAAKVRVWSAMRTFFNETNPQHQFTLEIRIPEADATDSTNSDEYQSVVNDESDADSGVISLRDYRGGSIVLHFDRRDDPDNPGKHLLSKTTPVGLMSKELLNGNLNDPLHDGFRFTLEWNSLNAEYIQAEIDRLKSQEPLSD